MTAETVPLRRISEIVAGQSPPNDAVTDLVDGLPFVQGNAEFGPVSPNPKFQCITAPKQCRVGDLLLSVRAPVGAMNLADREYGIGRGLAAVRLSAPGDQRFLSYCISASMPMLLSLATGSTFEAVTRDHVAAHRIPWLETAEQRRIADFLDDQVSRIDATLRATEQQISLLRSRETGWLDHQMQVLGREFGRVPLRRWITHIEQGWSPLCDSRPADAQEAGVLKLGSVRGGRFREQENKAMSEDTAPVLQYEIRPRDLLVSRANTPELVGEAAVVPDGVRSQLYLCDLLYRVRTSIEEVEFISAALRSRRSRGLLGVIARGTSQSMVKLRGEDIGNVSIPAAPSAARRMLADEAVATMADSDAAVAAIQDMRTLLQERKRTLITAAVTGEFDVSAASGRNIA